MSVKNDNMKGLEMKYFVLKPKGENQYAVASRIAMKAYATAIDAINPTLAAELRKWANSEHM